MEQYTILINTCDAYADVWWPFFRILEKTWPECKQHRILLNTETKSYSDPFFNVEVINSPKEIHNVNRWGARLKYAVKKADTEFVLFLLEDFFFEKKVDVSKVEQCLKYMEEDQQIVNFTMMASGECANPHYCKNTSRYDGYQERIQRGMFKLNASPGFWRKSALLKWTENTDSPWEWEYFGSMRTWFSKAKFFSRQITAEPILVYDVSHGGAVHRGKWVGKSVRKILAEHHIDIDLNERGVVEDWMEEVRSPIPFFLRLPSVIRNKTLYVKNIWLGIIKYQ